LKQITIDNLPSEEKLQSREDLHRYLCNGRSGACNHASSGRKRHLLLSNVFASCLAAIKSKSAPCGFVNETMQHDPTQKDKVQLLSDKTKKKANCAIIHTNG
jgi:hypothetical protein